MAQAPEAKLGPDGLPREAAPTASEPNMLERMSDSANASIQGFFYNLGVKIGTYPCAFLCGSLLFAILCICGNANFYSEQDPNKLWVPDDTPAQDDYAYVKQHYGSTLRFSMYDVECSSGNCLTKANLDAALTLYNDVVRINVSYTGERAVGGSEMLWFDKLCYMRGPSCWRSNVLEMFSYDAANWATPALIQTRINSAALTDTNGNSMNLNDVAGGFTRNVAGNVTGAAAMKFMFWLRNDRWELQSGKDKGKQEDLKADAWEEQFLEIGQAAHSGFRIERLATRSFGDEFGGAIQGDLIMINVAMILLCVYCTVMIGQCRRGKTRIALAVCGVLTVGLAIGGSMGLCSAFGLFYSPLASVLPFLLLGLGVDDMFVIAISFDLTDSKLSIPERLGRSLAHSGASIAVTSTTDFLAFIIGATTILPALRMFCFYAAVGILLILLLQVFCFSAMLVIDEQYKARGACDPCCCICSSCCWMPTWCSFWVCNGSAQVEQYPADAVAPQPETGIGAASASAQPVGTGSGGSASIQDPSSGSNKDLEEGSTPEAVERNCCYMPINILRGIMQRYLGPFLTSTLGMVVVVLLFAVLIGVGIWGATQIKEDSDYRDFMPAGSYVIDFIDMDEKYFITTGVNVAIYGSDADYMASHAEMEALYTAAQGSSVVMASTVASWEHDFFLYQGTALGGVATASAQWYINLNAWLAGPGMRFRGDIKFANNDQAGSPTNTIVSSRLTMNHRRCTNSKCEVENMDTLRNVVGAATPRLGGSKAPFAFDENYLQYEQYKTIEDEAQRNIGLAFVAIFLITIIMIPHPGVSLLVFTTVIFTIIEVVGFMYHWGLKVDGVTVVMLIVALGLAIDYSAHIGVAYIQAEAQTRHEGVMQALADMGTPVCHGATSTFIAIVVLAGSKSYVFISFFKQLFLATVLGAAQGLILLPVLLTLMGPLPRGPLKKTNRDDTVMSDKVGTGVSEVQMKDITVEASHPNPVQDDVVPDSVSHLHEDASAAAAQDAAKDENCSRVC